MHISVDWLSDYVDLSGVDIDELFLKFTMTTAEVEGVESTGSNFNHIVLARVDEVQQHPDADKLRVTQVFDGNETRQVVCGAPNVREGMLTALAMPGAVIGEMKIKKGKLRGQASLGMLCSARELGIGVDEEGIMDIQTAAGPGTALLEALSMQDTLVEIDNKSLTHRPDLWGHYGIAREVAAILKRDLKPLHTELPAAGIGRSLNVSVDAPDLCPRYMAVAVDGIDVKSSPDWMQRRLTAAGCRPINNIVDITNYVMLELGQPLHAFDIAKLEGQSIVVRRANAGETLETLDGATIKLDDSMCVIADAKKPVALAGVMGGENSKIEEGTTTLVLEAANFAPANNRATQTKTGIRTDSSARYEKHLDTNRVAQGAARFLELLFAQCPNAKIVSDLYDVNNSQDVTRTLEFPIAYANRKLGTDLSRDDIADILTRLGFGISGDDVLTVDVPTYRATKDITQPIDLVEEIGRVFGYDNIGEAAPSMPIQAIRPSPMQKAVKFSRELLTAGYGYDEVYNYAFTHLDSMAACNIEGATVAMRNPLSSEHDRMRISLIPHIVKNVADNQRHLDTFKLFEVGERFVPATEAGTLPAQFTDIVCASRQPGALSEEHFYGVRDAAVGLLSAQGITVSVAPAADVPPYAHPARCAQISTRRGKEPTVLAYVFTLHPEVSDRHGIEGDVVLAEIKLQESLPMMKDQTHFSPISKYPTVPFEVAVVCDETALASDIFAAIHKGAKNMVRDIDVFDIYRGDQVDANKKSVACRVTLGSDKGTLAPKQIEKTQQSIMRTLESQGYAIR